nr:hypothetical protein [Tanacetum cinerariifolium]
MKRGFLSQKGSRVGRGVKEKQVLLPDKSGEGSKLVDEALCTNYANNTLNVMTAGLGSYSTLSETHGHSPASANAGDMNVAGTVNTVANNFNKVGPTLVSNGVVVSPTILTSTFGVSNLYANVTGKSSRKSVNFGTLFTPGGNGVDVVVPMESIRTISERFANTAYGFFLENRVVYPVVANYNPDVNLLKENVDKVSVRVKLYGVPVTAFSKEGLNVIATKLGTPLMLDFYTSCACNHGAGNNEGTSNLASKEANPSGSSFWNVESSSTSTIPNVDKIGKLKKLIIDGKVSLVDDEGKPLKKVDYPGDRDSEDEVKTVDNDMAYFSASKRQGNS